LSLQAIRYNKVLPEGMVNPEATAKLCFFGVFQSRYEDGHTRQAYLHVKQVTTEGGSGTAIQSENVYFITLQVDKQSTYIVQ
jgi:hypothetical protein